MPEKNRHRFLSLLTRLLQAVLICLDHLLDHLAADGAGLASGDIAVITVLQVYTNLTGCSFNILKRDPRTVVTSIFCFMPVVFG